MLWYLVFCGFAINYMLRINLNLTIVAMVIPRPKLATNSQCDIENLRLYNKTDDSNNTLETTISATSHSERDTIVRIFLYFFCIIIIVIVISSFSDDYYIFQNSSFNIFMFIYLNKLLWCRIIFGLA